jgi:hypothetical protein
MHLLMRKLGSDVAAIQKQIPNKGFVERWRNLEDDTKDFAKQLTSKELVQPSQIWKFLMQSRPESVLYAAITSRPAAVEQRLKNFLTKWPLVKQKLPFPEMPEMRITPEHPEYKKIMDEAFFLLMDGKLRNHNEIVKYLEPYKPPEPPPPPPPVRRGRAAKKEAAAAAGATSGEPGAAPQPKRRGRKPKAATPEAFAAAAPPAPAQPTPAPAKEPEVKKEPESKAKASAAPPKKAAKPTPKPAAKKPAAKPAAKKKSPPPKPKKRK